MKEAAWLQVATDLEGGKYEEETDYLDIWSSSSERM